MRVYICKYYIACKIFSNSFIITNECRQNQNQNCFNCKLSKFSNKLVYEQLTFCISLQLIFTKQLQLFDFFYFNRNQTYLYNLKRSSTVTRFHDLSGTSLSASFCIVCLVVQTTSLYHSLIFNVCLDLEISDIGMRNLQLSYFILLLLSQLFFSFVESYISGSVYYV